MLDYFDYQKLVYEAFLDKRNQDNRFNFSVRQKASKGAEKNYFIGTEKGMYFSTTLWNIKVGYPGSAGDLINVIFSYTQKNTRLAYYIEFNQTNSPTDDQNMWALNLIKDLEPIVKDSLGLKKKSNPSQKICNYKSKCRQDAYSIIEELMHDVFQDLEILMPIVNRNITRIKEMHPGFFAHQLTNEEFESQQSKLRERLEKFSTKKDTSQKGSEEVKKSDKYIVTENKALNQILFGPPGTGKTYKTIEKAISIIHPDFDLSQDRNQIKAEYNRLVENGQIVFTTFHQSMSYEDFIEGIKPVEPEKEGDPINYKVELGIFRRLCVNAAFDLIQSQESKETEEVLDFSILYDNYSEKVQEQIFNNETVELESKSGGKVIVESISAQGNFIVKHPEGMRTYTISKPRLSKLNTAIKNLNDVSNINDQFREIIGGSNSSAYWAVLNAIRKETKKVKKIKGQRSFTFEEKLEVVNGHQNYKNLKGKAYVLIIDEINRGNVSQIFGELITLIEEDKRLGKEEELQVQLPYSKKPFGVPANLYIIGTMNTADRSVEALDAALRRRFNFEEMPPSYDLQELNRVIGGVQLSNLLKTINGRIEMLLDKDHLIGHSYFVKVKNIRDLQLVFQNKILPLLQEYFFGDYGKIGLILGTKFFEEETKNKTVQLKSFFDYGDDGFEERKIYRLKDLSRMNEEDFKTAIIDLIQ